MKSKLVIVESPAKARTLDKMLGKGYSVMATMGHVRDLPKSSLGIDIEHDFCPKYVTPREKAKVVKELKAAAKDAATIYLATDPDREGEAIAWHVAQLAGCAVKGCKRVAFHEITKEAIDQAFKTPREIDCQLVDAQQARRVLDRLVGYKLSPLLWRKVRKGLSAGRVQSVTLRIVVDREREILAFVPVEYWSIEAELTKKPKSAAFRAAFVGYADGKKLELHDKEQTEAVAAELKDSTYEVLKIKKKVVLRQPMPPFITSTLQQEAWRKLHFSAKQTMVLAQQLYEGLTIGDEGSVGLITYMRTDSTNVARTAIAETREYIAGKYGTAYLPKTARTFINRVKGAQEAHEAIRPTRVAREPSAMSKYLSRDQHRLYQLIWQRMVASQMAAAEFDNTSVDITARHAPSRTKYLLRTSASVQTFPGFLTLYSESGDEAEEKELAKSLPSMEEGEALLLRQLFPEQHFTQPPPRFTEASLIKMLESNGIGRPSTYAPTLSTIVDREYVTKEKGYLKPTELGMLVTDLLVKHFPDIIGIDFTAMMEDELDKVASNQLEWVPVVRKFYLPFEADLERAMASAEKVKIEPEELGEACPDCGKPLLIRIGRFGKFIACSGYPECRYKRGMMVKTGAKCPECGSDIVERRSKKRRIFYGCAGYPKCTFATFQKPLPQPCPDCGSLMTVDRDKSAKCTKCGKRMPLEKA